MMTHQLRIYNNGTDLLLEPQRWFASEFAKPTIYRKPREVFPKIVQEYLYDKVSTEVHVPFSGMANTISMIPELLNKY